MTAADTIRLILVDGYWFPILVVIVAIFMCWKYPINLGGDYE